MGRRQGATLLTSPPPFMVSAEGRIVVLCEHFPPTVALRKIERILNLYQDFFHPGQILSRVECKGLNVCRVMNAPDCHLPRDPL